MKNLSYIWVCRKKPLHKLRIVGTYFLFLMLTDSVMADSTIYYIVADHVWNEKDLLRNVL